MQKEQYKSKTYLNFWNFQNFVEKQPKLSQSKQNQFQQSNDQDNQKGQEDNINQMNNQKPKKNQQQKKQKQSQFQPLKQRQIKDQKLQKKQQQSTDDQYRQLPQYFLCNHYNQVQSMLIGAEAQNNQFPNVFQIVEDYFKKFKEIHDIKDKIQYDQFPSQFSSFSQKARHKGQKKTELLNRIKKFFDRQYQFSILFLLGHGVKRNPNTNQSQTYFLWYEHDNPIPEFISFDDIVSLWHISKVRYLLIVSGLCHSSAWYKKWAVLPQRYSICIHGSSNEDDITKLYLSSRQFRSEKQQEKLIGLIPVIVADFCQKYFEKTKNLKFAPQNKIKQRTWELENNNQMAQIIRRPILKNKNLKQEKYYINKKIQKDQIKSITAGFNRRLNKKHISGGLFHRRSYEFNQQIQTGFFFEGGLWENTFHGYGCYSPNTMQGGFFSHYGKFQRDQLINQQHNQFNSKRVGQSLRTWDQYSNKVGEKWTFNQFVKGKAIQKNKKCQYNGLEIQFSVRNNLYFLQINFYPDFKQDQKSNKKNLVIFRIQNFQNLQFKRRKNVEKGQKPDNYEIQNCILHEPSNQDSKEKFHYSIKISYQQNGSLELNYNYNQKGQTKQYDSYKVEIHKEFGKNNCLQRVLVPGYQYNFFCYSKYYTISIKKIGNQLKKINRRIQIGKELKQSYLKSIGIQIIEQNQQWKKYQQAIQNQKNNLMDMDNLKQCKSNKKIFILKEAYKKKVWPIIQEQIKTQNTDRQRSSSENKSSHKQSSKKVKKSQQDYF